MHEPNHECPICGSKELRAINGRPAAQCVQCGAFERTRLMWLVLHQLLRGRERATVLHFAPERGLAARLKAIGGRDYRALDINPDGYRIKNVAVERFNLCEDLHTLAEASVDLIVHSHVLEHVPCNVGRVLRGLNAAIRPGGFHVFCVPVIGTHSEEDLDPALSAEERLRRFGQEDHVRRFGRSDVAATFNEVFGMDVHFARLVRIDPERLEHAGIPDSVLDGVSSHTVFAWQKATNSSVSE